MTNYYDRDGDRKIPYAEDSTRGSSVLNPIRYKGDMVTQAWIDSRIIATLTKWMDKSGMPPRTMSEVAREPLRMLVEFLVKNGEVEMVEDTSEARRFLEHWFRIDLSRGGRAGKNLLHNKVLSERRKELGDKLGRQRVDVATPIRKKLAVSPEELERLTRMAMGEEEQAQARAETDEEREARLARIREMVSRAKGNESV